MHQTPTKYRRGNRQPGQSRRWADAQDGGDATRVFQHLPAFAKANPGKAAVVIARVSTDGQNLLPQMRHLRNAVKERGLKIVGRIARREVGPAYLANRAALLEARSLARERNACVVFLNVSRAIRHEEFSAKYRPHLRADKHQLRELAEFFDGVPLVTVQDPSLTNPETLAEWSRLSKELTGKMVGRPRKNPRCGKKKSRRLELMPEVLAMHRNGLSQKAIARSLGLPRTTVQNWLKSAF